MEEGYKMLEKRVFAMVPDLTQDEWQAFKKAFIPKTIPKKTVLSNDGIVAKELYYIVRGCMRLYYPVDGEEVNVMFAMENQFTGPCRSFMLNEPNHQVFETLENSVVLAMKKVPFSEAVSRYPRLGTLRSMIAEENLFSMESIVSMLLIHSPEERYLFLVKNHRPLIHRIPQYMLASLLGVSPVSLSRIKKRILMKDLYVS